MRTSDHRLTSHFDWVLFGVTSIILALGLFNLYSATWQMEGARLFKMQLLWIGGGSIIVLLLLFFDYRLLERLAYPLYILALFLLLMVMLKGKTVLGARRWLQIGSFALQPSELIKPAIVLLLARYFNSKAGSRLMGFSGILVPGLLTAVPMALILKQPDLGTALIVGAVGGAMILFAGIEKKVIVTFVALGALGVPLAWQYGLHEYQKDRVRMFVNPEKDAKGKGYQTIQSRIAIGSGQLIGKGYLKGTQTKLEFLPEHHTDFAFANFAEEFGFFGSLIVIFLYASLTLLGINVAQTAKDRFGMMLALGMTALIGTQIWIHIAMEMGMLPVVGVPLPLFSYGGTSLISTLIAIGILLNISTRKYLF